MTLADTGAYNTHDGLWRFFENEKTAGHDAGDYFSRKLFHQSPKLVHVSVSTAPFNRFPQQRLYAPFRGDAQQVENRFVVFAIWKFLLQKLIRSTLNSFNLVLVRQWQQQLHVGAIHPFQFRIWE